MADEFPMELNGKNVRKWGRWRVGVSDYGASGIIVPHLAKDLFDSTSFKPKPFPAGVKELGYLTTDGIVNTKSISSNDTNMLQTLDPVRSDLESIQATVKLPFGESNAWTNAFYHGLPVEDWPDEKDAAWLFSDLDESFEAEYVIWMVGVDGVGAQARFRYEIARRAKITSLDDRTENRSTSEVFGVTVGCYRDPLVGHPVTRAEEGPGFVNHLSYA